MATIKFLLVMTFFSLALNVRCQTFKITSLDNKEVILDVRENIVKNRLEISANGSQIIVSEFTDLDEGIEVVNKRFLKIGYKVRGGSGVKIRRVILVSSLNGKLVESLHVLTYQSSMLKKTYDSTVDSRNIFDEYYVYKSDLTVLGNNLRNACVKISTTTESKSRIDQYDNYSYAKSTMLGLDSKTGVFYNEVKDINQQFVVYDSYTNRETKISIKGKYPFIQLPEHRYVIVNGIWYEMDDKYLSAQSHRNTLAK